MGYGTINLDRETFENLERFAKSTNGISTGLTCKLVVRWFLSQDSDIQGLIISRLSADADARILELLLERAKTKARGTGRGMITGSVPARHHETLPV